MKPTKLFVFALIAHFFISLFGQVSFAHAQTVYEGSRPFQHIPSGFVFPSKAGNLEKLSMQVDGSEGSSITVNYATPEEEPTLHVSIHVHPLRELGIDIGDPALVPAGWMPEDFMQFVSAEVDFLNVIRGIGKRNPNMTVLDDTFITMTHQNQEFIGRTSNFLFRWEAGQTDFNGTVHSFDYDGWIVTYRFTYPLAKVLTLIPEYTELMENPLWPPTWNDPEKSILTRGHHAKMHEKDLQIRGQNR